MTWELEYVNAPSGNTIEPHCTTVILKKGDKEIRKAGMGNGPVDSAWKAIQEITGSKAELVKFSMESNGPGTDSNATTSVVMREDGFTAFREGTHCDIVVASAEALVDGVNQLATQKEKAKKPPVTQLGQIAKAEGSSTEQPSAD